MKAMVTICALCVLLAGCDMPLSNGRYQIAASGSGFIYRVDTRTGTVWNCSLDGCETISPDSLAQ